MRRRELLPAGGPDAEALREHADHRAGLHLADPGQREQALLEIGAVAGSRPDRRPRRRRTRSRAPRSAPARGVPCWRGSGAVRASPGRPPRARPGSIAAIAGASSPPSRFESSSGDENAFCTVTCWSSTKPIMSASGLAPRNASASGSPVKWMVRRSARRDPSPSRSLRPPARVTLAGWTHSPPSRPRRAPGSSGRSPGPTPAQEAAWPVIATGAHVLVQAPTGSGKTLAAFLTGIDRLNATPGRGAAAALRLAVEGAQLRRRAQPARPARGARLDAGGRRPHGRHRPARAPPDAAHAAGHPDHDARVALPAAHLAGPRDAARGRDGDRRRGPRRRRHEAWRPSRALARAARPGRRAAVPADRPLRDAAAARGDRALRLRRPADRARRRGHAQGARPRGGRRARGHARARLGPGPRASSCCPTAWRWRPATRRRRARSGRRSTRPCSTSCGSTAPRSCSSTTGGWPSGSPCGSTSSPTRRSRAPTTARSRASSASRSRSC